MVFHFSFYHTAAALHNSIIISTPAVQIAYYTELLCRDIEQKIKLFEIAQHSWQRCSANEAHSDNEEWKIVTFADQKPIDCTNNVNEIEIIALAGSGFTIIIARSCTSGSSTAKMLLIVAFGAYGHRESLCNSARKMISAHPTSVNGKFPTYNEEANRGTLYWWYRACSSLDCIKQSSTFCSHDHYRLYQKLTFYNSAIGEEWHIKQHSYSVHNLKRYFAILCRYPSSAHIWSRWAGFGLTCRALRVHYGYVQCTKHPISNHSHSCIEII